MTNMTAMFGAVRFTITLGICAISRRKNKAKPWTIRLFQSDFTETLHNRSVRNALSPPIRKKSAIKPIINPINSPATTKTTKITAHIIPKNRSETEKRIPCKK